jgi:ubiquinone/menaquinone biosynthesis C-methylase UbiE
MGRLGAFGKYASERGLGWALLYSVRKASMWAIAALDERLVRIEKRRRIAGPDTVSSKYHTVEENTAIWDAWDWSSRGEQWTEDVRLYRGIDPAVWKAQLVDELIVGRVPQDSVVLEIGPGAGRWSEFLLQRARRLILADISSKCVEICRERFGEDPRVELHRIDDGTLSFVGDDVVDVVWAYDVFVHINPQDTDRYLGEIRRVLRSGGTGVIHHPGTYANEDAHTKGYRSHVTAQLFADMASRHGLAVVEQDRSLSHMPGDVVSILSKE